jgi:hypothetical protein
VNRTSYGWIQLLQPFPCPRLVSSRPRLHFPISPIPASPHEETENSGSVCEPHPSVFFSLRSKSPGHCPVASTGMRPRACEESWAHVCSSFTWPPSSVSHSLQTFSPLADSRSCEIDSCHMFDHMALSRVRGRKVCGSCLTVPRARDKHWRGKYEALLARRLRLIGVSCLSVPRFQVPSLHSTSLQSELTSSFLILTQHLLQIFSVELLRTTPTNYIPFTTS